jgi:hypothetical protein
MVEPFRDDAGCGSGLVCDAWILRLKVELREKSRFGKVSLARY